MKEPLHKNAHLQRCLKVLHSRLTGGESDVWNELAGQLLPLLVTRLSRKWSNVDSASINDAAEDAILTYLIEPTVYDPSRSPLDRYLVLIAENHLRDAFRRRQRRLSHEIAVGFDWPDLAPQTDSKPSRWHDLRAVLRAAHTDRERAFIIARLRGERRPTVLANLLGVSDLPVAAGRAEVTRIWMRLLQRVRRARLRKTSGNLVTRRRR